MFKNNIKLFFRNVKKNKTSFAIKTVGLAVGIASFLILSLYVYNDLTYDQFHENLAHIYRVREGESIQTKGRLLPEMLEEIPEVEDGTRIFDWGGERLSYKDKFFFESIDYVDPGFFSIFTFPFVEGQPSQSVQEKYGAVISTDFAQKYFGDEKALGKQFHVGFGDIYLTVKGVVDIPANSSIQFNIIASYETGEEIMPWMNGVHDWFNTFSNTYVQLRSGARPEDISPKLQQIVKENFLPVGENETVLNLLAMKDFHAEVASNRALIVILAIIALGVLAIALVNFVNLTITNSLNRTKEIGIKKVHGADKKHLFRQITTESLLTGLASMILGVLLTVLILPTFNTLFATDLHFSPLKTPFLTITLLLVWLFVGLVSGLVPSLYWNKGHLVQNLHGKLFTGKKGGVMRHSSIAIQFVIAMILISGTFLIRKQINHMMTLDPKFDTQNVITIQTNYWQYPDLEKASQSLAVLSQELESSPYVESVSFSGIVPGSYHKNYNTFYPEGDGVPETLYLRKAYVGANYFKTFGMPILNGVGFEKGTVSKVNTVVLNKAAMDQFGITEAAGQVIHESSVTGEPYRVIGMVDNFSYQGVQHEMEPLAHFFTEQEQTVDWDYLSVLAKPGTSLQVIDLMKQKWQELLPEASLEYFFANDRIQEYYVEYVRINKLILWFSILSIVLSCMGLFAMASYAMARRTKEIGIRKVNGATISQMLTLLNMEFIRWVGLAFVIAVPLSWYAMYQWLEGFAYKTSISWWIFGVTGCIVLGITLITVSWQSFKAATTNPAEVLRDE